MQNGTQKILLLLVINDRNDSFGNRGGAYGMTLSSLSNCFNFLWVCMARLRTVYYNIALKINAKLGGVNQAVLFKNETPEAEAKDSVMYVGIDVTHPTANSGIDISIASMVANFDLAATRYTNEIFAQMKGKETVECFERQFCRLMTKFHEVCFKYDNGFGKGYRKRDQHMMVSL
ncbi:unnamed protein product [Cylicostephanus goldi]|uniref:Piwi domain-containing protein n=1 Tax=Cylicostephanus goldi TaxID=71465 RepID=A0A3P7MLM5_CYLGO|nr:unnamed protein product [Cylicostephanus goldi]